MAYLSVKTKHVLGGAAVGVVQTVALRKLVDSRVSPITVFGKTLKASDLIGIGAGTAAVAISVAGKHARYNPLRLGDGLLDAALGYGVGALASTGAYMYQDTRIPVAASLPTASAARRVAVAPVGSPSGNLLKRTAGRGVR